MADRTVAQSSALRAIGPSLSSDHDSAIAPCRLTRPNVGLRPVTPQKAEGQTIEPKVSLPIANPARPAATTAPEPLEEPQVQQLWFQGFLVAPPAEADAKR